MSRTMRFKIGVVAILWAIIGIAAAAGWMIGHGSAAMRITELKQQLAATVAPKQTCGMEIELLEARESKAAPPANPFGIRIGGFLPSAPRHLHLREILTR